MKKLLSLVILLVIFCHKNAQSQTAPLYFSDSLQSILNNALPATFTNSGAVLGIYVPGKWAWFGSSGKAIAGITSGQPMTLTTPTTQFRVGSITKTMVATCIMKLEELGFLSIDDPINNYLPNTLISDTLNPSDTIRIRHLLNHTSGIANSADNASCQMDVLSNPLNYHSLEDAVYCGASQGELFPPGFAWGYSNTNYSILAMIIENVTGQSYQDFWYQTIVTPLALTQTEIPVTNQIANPHMGCYWNIGSWVDLTIINPSTYSGWADVVSTTNDLIIFYENLSQGNIINTTELNRMKTIDPASFDYGMGIDFYSMSGTPYFGHYGEVANTSGMFYADVHNTNAPNGYYISYNFNTQGVAMQSLIDIPVLNLLNSVFSGVENKEDNVVVNVFPNPANTKVNINCKTHANFLNVKLYSMDGKLAKNVSLNGSSFELPTDDLPRGIYNIIIENEKFSHTEKLILN